MLTLELLETKKLSPDGYNSWVQLPAVNNGVGEEIQDQGSGGSGTEPENSDGPGRQNRGEGGEHVEVGGGEELEEEGDTVDVARRVEEEEPRSRELVVETARNLEDPYGVVSGLEFGESFDVVVVIGVAVLRGRGSVGFGGAEPIRSFT